MFTDTLGVTFAGNLVNPFEGDSGETVFRAGRWYDVALAVTDTTYYDFIRSGNDPFTGRGFINYLEGGLGVFGSVETRRLSLRVVAEVNDPREGVYRITGVLGDDSVNLAMELYVDDLEHDHFSAFLEGDWLGSLLFRDGSGLFNSDLLLISFFRGITSETFEQFVLRGRRPGRGQPFSLEAFGQDVLLGTLTAVQETGPPGAPSGVAAGIRGR